jgi:hypothetical protein
MALRRADRCSQCAADLPVGTRAEWDSDLKAVTCLPCVDARPAPPADLTSPVPAPVSEPADAPPEVTLEAVEEPPVIDVGVPGASARKEHQRRQAKRQRQMEEKWGTGRLGRIAKALSDDPQRHPCVEGGRHR